MIIYPTCESIPSTCASLEDIPAHGIYCIYPCRSTASQGEVVSFYHGSSQSSSNFVCMLRNCFDLFCYQNQALVKIHSLFTDPTSLRNACYRYYPSLQAATIHAVSYPYARRIYKPRLREELYAVKYKYMSLIMTVNLKKLCFFFYDIRKDITNL